MLCFYFNCYICKNLNHIKNSYGETHFQMLCNQAV